MSKRNLGVNVYVAAQQRLARVFDDYARVYVSFSAGKDSTVLLQMSVDEARKRGRRIGVLLVDLEAQYRLTIEHALSCLEDCADCADVYWVSLPLHLRNAVSVYEPFWLCWDDTLGADGWVRQPPKFAITDPKHFPFFRRGMEFEEFVPAFGEWYSQGEKTACLVGIRADESLNRYRTIARTDKEMDKGIQWTTRVTPNVTNAYPIYDWKTSDIWVYHAKTGRRCNELYNRMHLAGLTIHQMRICQPYGDDQRKGLWLFHLIEPETWSRVVARVSGANGGALYVGESGNVSGVHRVRLPKGHTWKTFAEMLLASLPDKTREHYQNKIRVFLRWWSKNGYPEGIPQEAPREDEADRKAPSWRRVCKALLRNDFWCKGLSFSQQKSAAYSRYLAMKKEKVSRRDT